MFATREGQTGKVAGRLAERLQASGATVELVNAADAGGMTEPGFREYDLLVFGASMHAGGLESELVEFINRHAAAIEPLRRSFFLVLLSAAAKDPVLKAKWLADARAKMDEQLEVDFDDVEMIAGALAYSKYPLPLKWLMRRIAKQAGEDTDTSRDYEYTDWDQVRLYAERLLES